MFNNELGFFCFFWYNLTQTFKDEDLEGRVRVINDDGSVGYNKGAPFDRIYLTAGVKLDSFNPSLLAEQLNPKMGILVFPEVDGVLIKWVYKSGIRVEEKNYEKVAFVPLIGRNA